jgi:hypothetical protein
MEQVTPDQPVADAIGQLLKLMSAKFNGGLTTPLYWIATILRGPDEVSYSDSTLKGLTTARIRGFLYGKLGITGMPGSTNPIPLTAAQMQTRDMFLATCLKRYVKHYNNAVSVIKDAFGYDLMTETDLTVPVKPVMNSTKAKKVFDILDIIWNNGDIYNIIVSLRSADSCKGSKSNSTVRIREFLDSMMKTGTPGTPLTADEMKERDELLKAESTHYVNYYWGAVEAIKYIFEYDLATETVVKS